jgi:hypothetical protein
MRRELQPASWVQAMPLNRPPLQAFIDGGVRYVEQWANLPKVDIDSDPFLAELDDIEKEILPEQPDDPKVMKMAAAWTDRQREQAKAAAQALSTPEKPAEEPIAINAQVEEDPAEAKPENIKNKPGSKADMKKHHKIAAISHLRRQLAKTGESTKNRRGAGR